MYNLALEYNSRFPDLKLSPDTLTGIFLKESNTYNITNLNSIIFLGLKDIIDNIISEYYENSEILTTDIIQINEISINLFDTIFTESVIQYIFRDTSINMFYLKDINDINDKFNDYWSYGLKEFLSLPDVYIDKFNKNINEFYTWIYNYMISKKDIMIQSLL